MAKVYRNIGAAPIYIEGKFVQRGETTTLPEGVEAGANLEFVGDDGGPERKPKGAVNPNKIQQAETNAEMQRRRNVGVDRGAPIKPASEEF